MKNNTKINHFDPNNRDLPIMDENELDGNWARSEYVDMVERYERRMARQKAVFAVFIFTITIGFIIGSLIT